MVATRKALHALAERVISTLRVQETGNEIALQPRPGGFGTPDLPNGGWVGISGTDVVNARGEREPITSLRAAAAFVGLRGADLDDAPLTVDAAEAAVLADAWAMAEQQLDDLATEGEDASPVHLWPEHFDIAIELGAEPVRATYGVSPGDDDHPEPYAYIAPWTAPADDPFWNATGFKGAETQDLNAAPVLWRTGYTMLTSA
jgi:hypothetical protein